MTGRKNNGDLQRVPRTDKNGVRTHRWMRTGVATSLNERDRMLASRIPSAAGERVVAHQEPKITCITAPRRSWRHLGAQMHVINRSADPQAALAQIKDEVQVLSLTRQQMREQGMSAEEIYRKRSNAHVLVRRLREWESDLTPTSTAV